MRILLICLLVLPVLGLSQPSRTYFVSPSGDDSHSGATLASPLASISKAFQYAQAGDTIALLPGVYEGRTHLVNQHGQPDRPIVLTSYANDPKEFAVIDGLSQAALSVSHEGLYVQNCSWLTFEKLIFKDCWTHVIQLIESNYITIRSCHFSTGKRVIHAVGHQTHHVLVEHCYIKHPLQVWKGWSWESLHHGELSYYNGALLHPKESGGGHIMRSNTILNLYNAFRTRPVSIKEDGNTEIYDNTLVNIRDNEFEPETWAWNMHYAYNRHINIHKMYSIDGVKGGNIYIYGNTYTQTTDPWAIDEVSGIFKYKGGPITSPCYAFNNSYYTEAKVMKEGEASNHLLKHFNNAYFFFQGSNRFLISDWQPGYEFDYDCINHDWPAHIQNNQQEQHGMALTDAQFEDGLNGDFRLKASSPCIDAGTIMNFPEYEWTQSYDGAAPDIGAFEGSKLTDGPPFRFLPSPEGAFYQERPRISKHLVDGSKLALFFTTAINPDSISTSDVSLFEDGQPVAIDSIRFPHHHHEMVLYCKEGLEADKLSLLFANQPVGQNGLKGTYWGSSIPIGTSAASPPDLTIIADPHTHLESVIDPGKLDISVVPNPVRDSFTVVIKMSSQPDINLVNHIIVYTPEGIEVGPIYGPKLVGQEVHFQYTGEEFQLSPGVYLATGRVGEKMFAEKFLVE